MIPTRLGPRPLASTAAADLGVARGGTTDRGGTVGQITDSRVTDGGIGGDRRVIRLLIADDDALVRAGLRILVGGSADIEVVAEAEDGAKAVTASDAYRPDVILMDIRMPGVDGLAATRRIRSRARAPQVIVLTTFGADEYVLEALRSGASGFLLKDTAPLEILSAVRSVAAGAAILSPMFIRRLIDHVADPQASSRRARARSRLTALTERENEVAIHVGHGHSNAEIATLLRMGLPTVKGHVSRLLSKLDLNNRVQIALLVHDAELL
ncbi:response regulator transcription factor [Actinoplanes derwentensis]|nr:response regulator transcription factor [Actinoplanes derwentensis]